MISVNDVVYEHDKVSKWWISKPLELCGCYLAIENDTDRVSYQSNFESEWIKIHEPIIQAGRASHL